MSQSKFFRPEVYESNVLLTQCVIEAMESIMWIFSPSINESVSRRMPLSRYFCSGGNPTPQRPRIPYRIATSDRMRPHVESNVMWLNPEGIHPPSLIKHRTSKSEGRSWSHHLVPNLSFSFELASARWWWDAQWPYCPSDAQCTAGRNYRITTFNTLFWLPLSSNNDANSNPAWLTLLQTHKLRTKICTEEMWQYTQQLFWPSKTG